MDGPRPSGSRAPRSCTSRRASTASRAPSTRPSAGCCPPRRRSSAASLRRRSVARSGWQVDHLDPAPGAAGGTAEGRCARRDRRRRRHVERDAARGLRGPDRGAARRARSRTSSARRSSASRSRRPTSRRSTATSSAATSTAARARSTRTSCGARLPQAPGHATPVDGLWHIGATTHPGPGLGAGSGYLVAKELTKPPLTQRLLAQDPRPLVILSLSEISTSAPRSRRTSRRMPQPASTRSASGSSSCRADDAANIAFLREHGLRVAVCVPDGAVGAPAGDRRVWKGPPIPPSASRRSSAPSLASPSTSRPASRASRGRSVRIRLTMAAGSSWRDSRRVAVAARLAGVLVGFEPVHASQRDEAGFVNSLADTDAVLASVAALGDRRPLRHVPPLGRPGGDALDRRQRRQDRRRPRVRLADARPRRPRPAW